MKEINKERHYGLDLLRIVCMFLIVVLHILYLNGIPGMPANGTMRYWAGCLMKCICIGVVNCYAMTSGYFGVGKKNRFSGIAALWLQVVFYSVGITAAIKLLAPRLGADASLLEAFFPVNTQQYWYFSAYFLLCLFAPVLETAVKTLTVKQLTSVVISGGVFLCASVFVEDAFLLNNGLSGLWLMYLYLVGGLFRQLGLSKAFKKGALLYLIMTALTTLAFGFLRPGRLALSNLLIQYNSPAVFLGSVGMFCAFAGLEIKKGKALIGLVAPLTFGIYLIHTHPIVFGWLIGRFRFLARGSSAVLVAGTLGIALGIFLFCAVIDWLRLQLFRLLRIKPALQKLEMCLRKEK